VGSVNANSDSRSDEELKEIMSDANIQDDIMRKYIKVLKNNGNS
jgi:predicted transcriptional regulator